MNQLSLLKRELPYEIAEELKTLRTNIQFCGDDKRIIMITSCVSGEGKSEVSLNLARSFAELGKNVVLIDTDLRKSVLRDKIKNGKITSGLTHYLIGRCSAEDIIYSTDQQGLYIIPAGATPPNPSELLSTKRMDDMLSACRENYDYVIVDCAPLGMVVDASVIAPHCDGAMLLIEANSVARAFAAEVAGKLKNTGVNILGVVLNKVDTKSGSHYGHYGRYGRYGRYGKYTRYDRYSRYESYNKSE